ncbi:MAG: UbiD family decarboxylase [Candidatus Sumerlaeota bacterium]
MVSPSRETPITTQDIVAHLWRRRFILLVVPCLAVVAGYVGARMYGDIYRSRAILMIREPASSFREGPKFLDFDPPAYADFLKSDEMLLSVIQTVRTETPAYKGKFEDLKKAFSIKTSLTRETVTTAQYSPTLELTVDAPTPKIAHRLAEVWVDRSVSKFGSLRTGEAAQISIVFHEKFEDLMKRGQELQQREAQLESDLLDADTVLGGKRRILGGVITEKVVIAQVPKVQDSPRINSYQELGIIHERAMLQLDAAEIGPEKSAPLLARIAAIDKMVPQVISELDELSKRRIELARDLEGVREEMLTSKGQLDQTRLVLAGATADATTVADPTNPAIKGDFSILARPVEPEKRSGPPRMLIGSRSISSGRFRTRFKLPPPFAISRNSFTMTDQPVRNLRQFISLLRRAKQLAVVSVPVSTDQEIAEIHRRVIAAGGPALLFTNVQGSQFPVVTNLFGTRDRVDLAFGKRPERFVKRAVDFVNHGMPPTLSKLWQFRDLGLQGMKIGTRAATVSPVLQVVDQQPDLEKVPLLKLWPEDGGHFVTLPLVYTEHPDTKKPNLGMYRMQRYNKTETGMHWQIGKGGGFHYHRAEERGEALPVTVFLGGPPGLILSAIAPLPEDVPELLLASLMLGEKLRTAKTSQAPHAMIAEAEFALIGSVAPKARQPEGPFGDHYGYYSLRHDYPVFKCKAIARRAKPIYPATIVGKPRQEDFFIGDYLQDLLSPLFPVVMPSVRDLWSYGETGFHSLAAAVVKDRYPREALQSAFRILGEGQLSLTKFLIVTDKPQDLRNFRTLLQHTLARANWETDLYVFSNLSMDTLDYTGPEVNKGSKGVIAALGDAVRELPRAFNGELYRGLRDACVYCPGCLVVGGASYSDDPELPATIAKLDALKEWPMVILCDKPNHATASDINFLWTVFTRFEPAAHIHARDKRIVRSHIAYSGPLVIDARIKPPSRTKASIVR